MVESLHVREASDEEIEAILWWTHPLWGGGRTFEAYVARTRTLLDMPWGRERYRFHLGLDAAGTPVTACKTYAFDMLEESRPTKAIGFGAVFTPESERGKGYAAALLRDRMADAERSDVGWALLYSDIGTAYYERLGYRTTEALTGEASAQPGRHSWRSLSVNEARKVPELLRAWPQGGLEYMRTDPYLAFVQEREGAEWVAFASLGEIEGLAALEKSDRGIYVGLVALAPGAEAIAAWNGLRALAASRGAETVTGRVTCAAEAAGFIRRPLTRAIPMVAPLGSTKEPPTSHWWGLDHF